MKLSFYVGLLIATALLASGAGGVSLVVAKSEVRDSAEDQVKAPKQSNKDTKSFTALSNAVNDEKRARKQQKMLVKERSDVLKTIKETN